jgi:hypothetical protein
MAVEFAALAAQAKAGPAQPQAGHEDRAGQPALGAQPAEGFPAAGQEAEQTHAAADEGECQPGAEDECPGP